VSAEIATSLRRCIGGRGSEVPQEHVPRFRKQLLAGSARKDWQSRASSAREHIVSAQRAALAGQLVRGCLIKARLVPHERVRKRARRRILPCV